MERFLRNDYRLVKRTSQQIRTTEFQINTLNNI